MVYGCSTVVLRFIGSCERDGYSTVVLIGFTCPAITVATVILWALDRVRGRALGWLGPGSPKSQPHQALRGVSKPTPGLASKPVGNGRWYVIPRFRDGHDHCAEGGSTNAGPMFGVPVDMGKSIQGLRVHLGFPVDLEYILEEKKPAGENGCNGANYSPVATAQYSAPSRSPATYEL